MDYQFHFCELASYLHFRPNTIQKSYVFWICCPTLHFGLQGVRWGASQTVPLVHKLPISGL